MLGISYVNPEEYHELLSGMSLSGITDDQLGSYLVQASRTVDNYCHDSFGLRLVEDEIQRFNENRRVWPKKTPVRAVKSLRLLIGSRQSAVVGTQDIFISPDQGMFEMISLANTTSLSGELLSLGLAEIFATYDYIAGDGEFVNSTTTITANVTDAPNTTGQSDIPVSDGTRFTVDDIIRINSEKMLIIVINVNTLTVLRGVNHRADAHTSGATVYRSASLAPDEIKLATAMIATAHIVARRQQEEGIAGVRSFLIGSYSVSFGPNASGVITSGFMGIPVEATRLLDSHRVIALR